MVLTLEGFFTTFLAKKGASMDEQPLQPSAQLQPSSFMNRAVNVFTSPGELYTEIASTPTQKSTWLLPLLLAIIVAMINSFVVNSNESFRQQTRDAQSKVYEKMVEKGWMTQEAREKQEIQDEAQKVPVVKVIAGSLFGSPILLIVGSFILFIVGKILKSPLSFPKYLELFGITLLIGILDTIITLVLMHALDSIYASPGGGLLLSSSFDPSKFSHRLIASVTVFGIWRQIVLGIGLSKFSGKSQSVTIPIVFVIWLVIVLGLVSLAGLFM